MQVKINDDVKDFLAGLEPMQKPRVRRCISLLEDYGHMLRMPFSRNILPGIFELRITGAVNIRLVFVYHNNAAHIFYAFIKKTNEISSTDMNSILLKCKHLQL